MRNILLEKQIFFEIFEPSQNVHFFYVPHVRKLCKKIYGKTLNYIQQQYIDQFEINHYKLMKILYNIFF